MKSRNLAILAGVSYIIIFFAAIFANFFALESIITKPESIMQNQVIIRLGIIAFLVTVVFDVIVAWALFALYKKHSLSLPSLLFRMMHATIMGAAIFALPLIFGLPATQVLQQVDVFNTMWLIGLFFFGIHLGMLSFIVKAPKWICVFLFLAGLVYIIDTCAHFLLPNYAVFADIFLAMVAIPSIIGEMSFAIWLLIKGGKS